MQVDTWAESIVRKVYETWQSEYSSWRPGIKVFYSPIRNNPDVMIVGHNPGGDENVPDFLEDLRRFRQGDFSLPVENDYLSHPEFRISRRMRTFFDDPKLLKESVTLNLLFFRSKDVKLWFSLPEARRLEMESFCHGIFREIVAALQPRTILALGMKTYDDIVKLLGQGGGSCVVQRNNGWRLVCKSNTGETTIFGIPHPSGARVSKAEWDIARKKVNESLRPAVTSRIYWSGEVSRS